MNQPTVAIVGRPNVGKSTIFNRLVGHRVSIVDDSPGITRDRIYAHAEWLGTHFSLIDTGGIDIGNAPFIKQITAQAEIAINEADVIIFMVNGQQDLTAGDDKIAKILYRTKKPVVLAVNKVDNPRIKNGIYNFYSLGFGKPYPISGAHGLGLGDLLDQVLRKFPTGLANHDDHSIRFSLIGRPNVGKSSLVNAILGQNRVIVSKKAGTTRDAVDTEFKRKHSLFTIADTAGLRKRGKIYENAEKYSVMRAMKAIDNSNVVVVVLDAVEGIREQDKKIAGYAHQAGKGIVIAVNKWDAFKNKNNQSQHDFRVAFYTEFKYLSYAPVIFVSAKTKMHLGQLINLIKTVNCNHELRIKSSTLNDVMMAAVSLTPTPSIKGRRLRIYYTTQVSVAPPTFICFVNDPHLMHFSYARYLKNQIREHFNFMGTPVKLISRRRK